MHVGLPARIECVDASTQRRDQQTIFLILARERREGLRLPWEFL